MSTTSASVEAGFRKRPGSVLTFATYLAPSIFPAYQAITDYVAHVIGIPARLVVGHSYEELLAETIDVAFVCGWPYVRLAARRPSALEVLAAPVLCGTRYQGRAIYFSDVIVRRRTALSTFDQLRGGSWAYNEPSSFSGYLATLLHLAQLGETEGYFGRVVESGWHERSIEMVRSGDIDASAIDSHVLEHAFHRDPSLNDELRVIASFGPAAVQPAVAGGHLPAALRNRIRGALLSLSLPEIRNFLIEGFQPAVDSDYDGIRAAESAVQLAGVSTLAARANDCSVLVKSKAQRIDFR